MDLYNLTKEQQLTLATLYSQLAKAIRGRAASGNNTDREFWDHQIDQIQWAIAELIK